MPTILPSSELLRRAVILLDELLREYPERPFAALLDEVSMRFTLSPLDAEALARLFSSRAVDETTGLP